MRLLFDGLTDPAKAGALQSTDVRIFDHTYKVFGDPHEGWFNRLRQKHEFTEFNLENLRPMVGEYSICIDAGANLGMMTLAMAYLAPQGYVYAFEGSLVTYAALEKTIAASGETNIKAFPYILGKDAVSAEWIDDKEWASSSHCIPSSRGTRQTRSIDSLDFEHVDVIKIDVEGAELDVLEGASATLRRCKPIVTMEFNSFSFVHYRDIVPRQALQKIFDIFPQVFYFDKRTGPLLPLKDRETFLRQNMLGGFVDDLVCSWQ